MKFIKDKALYEIPDKLINKEFGNIYIFQHSLEVKEDNADSWLEKMLKSKEAIMVSLEEL